MEIIFFIMLSFLFFFIVLFFYEKVATLFKLFFLKDTAFLLEALNFSFVFIRKENIFFVNYSLLVLVVFLFFYFFQSVFTLFFSLPVFYFLRRFFLFHLCEKRKNNFHNALPDGLLAISNGIKSGLALNHALDLMVSEMEGPISQEFSLVIKEVKMGVSLQEALDNLLKRVYLVDLEIAICAIKIARETGGPLSDILKNLSDTVRRKIQMERKIKSLTSQGRMQGFVMVALPFMVGFALYNIEQEAMRHLFTDPIGWIVLAVCFFLVSMGIFFIKKIVDIDI